MRFLVIVILLSLLDMEAFGQTQDSIPHFYDSVNNNIVFIGNITLKGNKKTRDNIILREVTFKKGDKLTINDLNKQLKISKDQIFNTELFVDDSVYISNQKGPVVDINIVLKERWYFFPLPYFKLIDRNFNQWWEQENHSLSRIDFGIKFMETNLTGRNDKLNVWLIDGYNQQVSLRYDIPFFDKKLKHGINIGMGYSRQRELNYATSTSNKQLFFKEDNDYAKVTKRVDVTYSYRPNQKIRHYFRLGYYDEAISDSIFALNPQYYPDNLKRVGYFAANYSFNYYDADYYYFPTKGIILNANISKKGFDKVNDMWQTDIHLTYATHLYKNSFLLMEAAAAIKFPYNPFFYNQNLFGKGTFQLSGQEYNVVDGLAGLLGKATIEQKLFTYILHNPIHSKSHDKLPFSFYLNIFGNLAYCDNPYYNTSLNNKLMYTYGVGLDIVSIYDFVFRINWAFNQLDVNGIYFHTRNDF